MVDGHVAIPGDDLFIRLFKEDIEKLESGESAEFSYKPPYQKHKEKKIKLTVVEKIPLQKMFIGPGYSVRRYPPLVSCTNTKRYNIRISKERFKELKEKYYIGTRRGSSRLEIGYSNI